MPQRSTPLLEDLSRESAPAIAIHIPLRLIGIVLALFVAVLLLALASWSVDDPSLSYATTKHPANWLAGSVLTAGVLAFVAVPESWPLPTGLGGIVGQGFETLATTVSGAPPKGVVSALFALVLLTPTLVVLWIAFGFHAVSLAAATAAGKSAVRARGRQRAEEKRATEEAAWRDGMIEPSLDGRAAAPEAGAPVAVERRRINIQTSP